MGKMENSLLWLIMANGDSTSPGNMELIQCHAE